MTISPTLAWPADHHYPRRNSLLCKSRQSWQEQWCRRRTQTEWTHSELSLWVHWHRDFLAVQRQRRGSGSWFTCTGLNGPQFSHFFTPDLLCHSRKCEKENVQTALYWIWQLHVGTEADNRNNANKSPTVPRGPDINLVLRMWMLHFVSAHELAKGKKIRDTLVRPRCKHTQMNMSHHRENRSEQMRSFVPNFKPSIKTSALWWCWG